MKEISCFVCNIYKILFGVLIFLLLQITKLRLTSSTSPVDKPRIMI